ncbi:MAG TPA: MFS transporter [Thermoguttaceae bacterium]|nr:MFS transporter [Thermoguttaceae bacterium]
MTTSGPAKTAATRVPRVVVLLGVVSFCMDVSSEMIHSLLPVFLVSSLGASMVMLGVIEGIAEATASITKVFSGALSDWLGRRKPLAVLGYGVAALTKPLFPLATSAAWIFTARFVDRIGKGIRGAPRDALVADCTPPEVRGAAFGLRQSMDTAGALVGPLVALGLMVVLADNIRTVFWIAVVPAFVAVAVLVIGVKEPKRHAEEKARQELPHWRDLHSLGGPFWTVALIGAVFTLARFSEAFLVLRVSNAGLALAWTPLALVVMNLTYTMSAYPVGWVSDRLGRNGLLASGLVVLIVSDVMLALGQQVSVVMLGIALWGLHMGLTQGVLAAMVADTAPAALRGSAFGVFNFVGGIAALVASLLAGVFWTWQGPELTFVAGAVFSALALAGLMWWRVRLVRQ